MSEVDKRKKQRKERWISNLFDLVTVSQKVYQTEND